LPSKKRGFTILEVLVAAVILIVVLSGLFGVLSVGDFSNSISSAKINLQSDVRRAMGWISRDLRTAISWDVALSDNNPSTTHLKFHLWSWDTATDTWLLSASYVEYSYDAATKKLSRHLVENGVVTQNWEFNNIIEAPFYTTYVGRSDPANELNANDLLNNRNIIIVVAEERQVRYRGSLSLTYSLKEQIRIRNG
jgi:type II secretory pathway component PulJ